MKARRAEPDPLDVVRAYHSRTKHHLHRYAHGPGGLDWANQPDPFRRFAGAELLRLAIEEPDAGGPTYGDALREGGVPAAPLDARFLSRLFADGMGLSAWKQYGGARWALRINPSSGNLHPTEAYLVAGAVPGFAERPAVYHYAPREHALERRARVSDEAWRALGLEPGSLLVGLTSIHWREAWKYGERAYRYCQHDAGHAIAAIAIAAAGLGWQTRLLETLGDDAVAAVLGVDRMEGPEAEHPDVLLQLAPGDVRASTIDPAGFPALAWVGLPNDLSPEHVDWDVIDAVATAAKKPRTPPRAPWGARVEQRPLDDATPLRALVRQRRSAVAMDGKTRLSRDAFFRALERTLPRAGRVPTQTLPWSPRVHLAVFAHRVDGVEPGLYWLARDPDRLEAARAVCRTEFLWERPDGCPDDLPLFLLLPRELRGVAAQISCQQAIAGDGAFSLGMLADFERSLGEEGAWFYPRLFWETGVIGQVLYLEAEALGVRSTGIGCFFDDEMHALLGLRDRAWQSLYHFTVGGAVDDDRLTTHPPYPPLDTGR